MLVRIVPEGKKNNFSYDQHQGMQSDHYPYSKKIQTEDAAAIPDVHVESYSSCSAAQYGNTRGILLAYEDNCCILIACSS